MSGSDLLDPPPRASAAAHLPPPRESLRQRLRLFLRPSNFLGSIPGPIFHKDVRISGRKASTYWIRGLYAAALLVVIGITFLNVASHLNGVASPTLRLQSLQEIAPITTQVIIWFELIALAFAGAVFGAPTICDEKRAGTLGTLLTTPLKAWQIVLGKTLACFVQLLILTLIAAPLLLAIRIFGGVSAEVVIAGTSLALATALLSCICGVFYSIGAKRSPGASTSGFVMLVAIQGIVPLAAFLTEIRGWYQLPQWVYVCFSTPGALLVTTIESMGAASNLNSRLGWIASTGYTLAMCVIVLVAASIRLRGVLAREGEGGSVIPKAAPKGRKASPAAPTAPAPADAASTEADPRLPAVKKRRRRASSVVEGRIREVGDHPVLWRELRQAAFRSRIQLVTAVLAAVLGFGLLYYYVSMTEEALHGMIAVIGAVIMLLTAATVATPAISGERESRTWEVLQTTPLTARAIVFGKAIGAARRLWFVPALLAAHYTIAVVWSLFHPHGVKPELVLWLIMIIVPPVLFLVATGTLFSLLCRKSVGAATANLALAFGLWAIFPAFVAWFFFGLLDMDDLGENVMTCLMVFNPFPMIVEAIDATVGSGTGVYHFLEFRYIGFAGFFLACALNTVVYLAGAYLVLRWAQAILAAQTSRAK
jgi:ABC-type transport system involved in multi-copper enzyme maturation permease subunit